jgi:copper homeostasis protein
VDEGRTREMRALIGAREAVFHRAIDVTPDWKAALDTLIDIGVTRVLTSGQRPTVPEGAETLRAMIARAAGRIEILPGGGVTPENAAWCREHIGTDSLHAALHRTAWDRSTAGNPSIYFGGAVFPPEDRYLLSDAGDIAALLGSAE